MTRNKSQAFRATLILIFSVAMVAVVNWFVPSLSVASLNLLYRLRGAYTAPADIVIIGIDDYSLQTIGQKIGQTYGQTFGRRLGQWPWPRSVMASALDKLTQARARAVGLDVIYAEPSTPEEDRRLSESIARNGRVVLPAQLYESASKENPTTRTISWLLPLPEFVKAARAVGHAHVSPDIDGMARGVQLSKADDRAERRWALGLEVVRVAEQTPSADLDEKPGLLRFGAYRILAPDEGGGSTIPGVSVIRQNEMMINYAGPAGSFRYYSIADLIDGKIPPSNLTDKIALIGAVAESMGDTRVVPFMHYGDERSQGGREMPGVEIHANIINTIRSGLSFRSLPDWMAFVAALVIILLSAWTIRRFDGWSQILILAVIFLSILMGSFVAFSRYLIIPPLPAMLTGFLAVIPLMLNRSLSASRELDVKLEALVSQRKGFLSGDGQSGAGFLDKQSRLGLPRSLPWKLRAVDDLTTRLLTHMSFINRIFSSMGEGVLVTDMMGRIAFANHEAMRLFGCAEHEITGAKFIDFLVKRGAIDPKRLREAVKSVAEGRIAQLEVEIQSAEPGYYSLLLSALATNPEPPIDPLEERDIPSAGAIGVVALISDITKRVELDRIKTETLQLVSHELRTPLTSIQGLSDALIKFPVAADEANEMLRIIHSDAVRLGEMINRYLDITRLESGAQSLRLSQVACQQLVAGCIRNLSVFASERGIRLVSRVGPFMPALHVDAQLLTQAVNNLLSNAIKYSPPGSEITVSADFNQSNVMIHVQDQGFGVPEEAREKIFEKFYRLDRDADSTAVGAGLGLPLVKEIVERHGGRVSVESAPMKGSRFTIHLPLQRHALSAA
jgi:signal transduction histidine kinase/CHASE2 domain-containing sensor protein